MNRYLIVKLGALGDLSFAWPMATALKQFDPSGEVHWLVGSSFEKLLSEFHPHVDKIHPLDGIKLYRGNTFEKAMALYDLEGLLKGSYTAIFVAHRDLKYALALKLLTRGPLYQLVRAKGGLASWLRYEVEVPPLSVNESLGMKKLVERFTGREVNWTWEFRLERRVERDVILHLGGGANAKTEFRLKQWPKMKELALRLVESGRSVTLIGAAGEIDAQDIPRHARIEDLIGKTNLEDLIRVLGSGQIFVGGDSGPLHWADALGLKAIGLYGPTSPVSWGLLGKQSQTLLHSVPCSPCYKDDGVFPECPYEHRCMRNLSVESVAAKIEM